MSRAGSREERARGAAVGLLRGASGGLHPNLNEQTDGQRAVELAAAVEDFAGAVLAAVVAVALRLVPHQELRERDEAASEENADRHRMRGMQRMRGVQRTCGIQRGDEGASKAVAAGGAHFLKRSTFWKNATTFSPLTSSSRSSSWKEISIALCTAIVFSLARSHSTPASTNEIARGKTPRI